MLSRLSIRDIVLIERLDIDYAAGLSVLTGETGAGKSILLDAFALALGSRGDASLVRQGAEQGQVTAAFDVEADHPALALLSENGVSERRRPDPASRAACRRAHPDLQAGQTILINGAGGSVGGTAVQLAKAAGATVTATGYGESAERLRSYGADRIIDHRSTPVAEAGGPYDVVLNLVVTSPEANAELLTLVADGGTLASATTPPPEDPERKVRGVQVFSHADAAQLSEIFDRIDAGTLVIPVAGRRPLADLAAVHAEADSGRLPGKTVIVHA